MRRLGQQIYRGKGVFKGVSHSDLLVVLEDQVHGTIPLLFQIDGESPAHRRLHKMSLGEVGGVKVD
jgi:hypothetical protein